MSAYQNILVIHLMHLGDLMLGTPVLAALRQQYPAARITLLADKKLADVVAANEHLDECLLIDKKGADGGIIGILRYAMRLRKTTTISSSISTATSAPQHSPRSAADGASSAMQSRGSPSPSTMSAQVRIR